MGRILLPNDELVLRWADVTDIDALMHLEQFHSKSNWKRQHFLVALSAKQVLLASFPERSVGFLITQSGFDIVNLVVDPGVRRCKIGHRLISCFMEHARAVGASSCVLEVRAGNKAALAFYVSLGFHEIARRKAMYSNDEDAVVLEVSLLKKVVYIQRMKYPRVAIDGPAGSGKSTLARMLAQRLGYRSIHTGSLYRAVGLCAMRLGEQVPMKELLHAIARLRVDADTMSISLDGEDISPLLDNDQVAAAASHYAALPDVRHALLGLQRHLGAEGGVIFEGRDIGTVIFPDAEVKFFLTASIEARASRRARELGCPVEDVLAAMRERDAADTERVIAPLKCASDAYVLDTSMRSLEQLVDIMENEVRHRTY